MFNCKSQSLDTLLTSHQKREIPLLQIAMFLRGPPLCLKSTFFFSYACSLLLRLLFVQVAFLKKFLNPFLVKLGLSICMCWIWQIQLWTRQCIYETRMGTGKNLWETPDLWQTHKNCVAYLQCIKHASHVIMLHSNDATFPHLIPVWTRLFKKKTSRLWVGELFQAQSVTASDY